MTKFKRGAASQVPRHYMFCSRTPLSQKRKYMKWISLSSDSFRTVYIASCKKSDVTTHYGTNTCFELPSLRNPTITKHWHESLQKCKKKERGVE